MPTEIDPVGIVLATSYSRTAYRRTTIGAAAFHCRVRNGNGWGHCAIVTRDPSRIGGPSRTGGFGASRRRGSLETMSILQFQKNIWFSDIYIQEVKANI